MPESKSPAALMTKSAAVAAVLICVPGISSGMDISFYGRAPKYDSSQHLFVADGVEPGVLVVFDVLPGHAVLRPAGQGETTNSLRSVYRFEWRAEGVARFYEMTDDAVLKGLAAQNEADIGSVAGRAYEEAVLNRFFSQGVMQTCLPPGKPGPGKVTVFIVVEDEGRSEKIVALPEGSVAECIADAGGKMSYPAPTRRFTARADVEVAP